MIAAPVSACDANRGLTNCRTETQAQLTLHNIGFTMCLWLQNEQRGDLAELRLHCKQDWTGAIELSEEAQNWFGKTDCHAGSIVYLPPGKIESFMGGKIEIQILGNYDQLTDFVDKDLIVDVFDKTKAYLEKASENSHPKYGEIGDVQAE
ncbi:hypothetical protein CHUAL_001643 [Chamberlinius hualienensis]